MNKKSHVLVIQSASFSTHFNTGMV